MIFDKIENHAKYFDSAWSKRVFAHYESISADSKNGNTWLIDDKVEAKIMSYATKTADWLTESHKDFIDIQIVLNGSEILEVFSDSELEVDKAYNPKTDCTFFKLPTQSASNRLFLQKDQFCLLFPGEAHTTQIATNDVAEVIKKVVYKIHKSII